jgi:hypothetical protein
VRQRQLASIFFRLFLLPTKERQKAKQKDMAMAVFLQEKNPIFLGSPVFCRSLFVALVKRLSVRGT